MTTEQATNALRLHLQGKSVMTLEHALATMDALDEAIQVIRQRYADRELVRLGHIAREGMTPAQYLVFATVRAWHLVFAHVAFFVLRLNARRTFDGWCRHQQHFAARKGFGPLIDQAERIPFITHLPGKTIHLIEQYVADRHRCQAGW